MILWSFSLLVSIVSPLATTADAVNPYERQIADQLKRLSATDSPTRQAAADALGFLRAWAAADSLAHATSDPAPAVRRAAVLALGGCGQRRHLQSALSRLDDSDWSVRQAAWIALTNLTGMEWPFDALAAEEVRRGQADAWRRWVADLHKDQVPSEVLKLLHTSQSNLALGCRVTASSTYKGPADVLTDGDLRTFWQTKNVSFPQHCTIDLGRATDFSAIVVHQYASGYCMTQYTVSVSDDGQAFREVRRGSEASSPQLEIRIPPTTARWLRITSTGSQRPVYPTTIREIEVYRHADPPRENPFWCQERGLRALGSLGGKGAVEAAIKAVRGYHQRVVVNPSEKAMVQAGLRALGRLGDPASLPVLVEFLDNPQWARYAAEALGDLGDERAVQPLMSIYPKYARDLAGKPPTVVPKDDHPGLEPADRMYEIPHVVALTLARLPMNDPASRRAVAQRMPLLMANLPGDFDGAVFFETEASKRVAAGLLERTGLGDAARRAVLAALGQTVKRVADDPPELAAAAARRSGTTVHGSCWIPVVFTDRRDTADLLPLLEHADGWVRINAAKALMFLGATKAAQPLADLLSQSKREADYGYFGGFVFDSSAAGQDEYDGPTPRWREAYVRALGRLGDRRHVALFDRLLNDDANALEIRHAAAVALGDIGTPEALDVLARAESSHPYHSVRLAAREILWKHQRLAVSTASYDTPQAVHDPAPSACAGIVFIKGPSQMPNRFQIDPWRQTYSTTDSGPTYRLGQNLYVLRPPTSSGKAVALTRFDDGYVADCEVSWDGRRVAFAHRGGQTDPWWHIWEIGADGSGLRQITKGPYHDVQPAYLPDGRIVFASTRIGMRDEYHGYLATGLTVMNPDGSDIHCIGFNLGRDNEPAVLPDGRIVFSRLELFYSRLKTELALEAMYPDGTRNVTLYGPERRDFWAEATRKAGEHWWGEVPPRHRVLRLTQAQPFEGDTILCASTAGLVAVGPDRWSERLIPHDRSLAVTSPFPLDDHRILCAATAKHPAVDKKGRPGFTNENDLGIYLLDALTGKMELLYNDPQAADFEPRPLMARKPPPVVAESPAARSNAFSARFLCASVKITQEPLVRERGRLARIIEGMPITGRHSTHQSTGIPAWKNHTGTLARVLGTVPLAADGSFYVEVPADRLIHVQVLDSDRRVVGNQLLWMYARPKETRSCVGCHEYPNSSPAMALQSPQASTVAPLDCLPKGGEFTYRAKLWNKGVLSDEAEERTRTVRAVNLIGRQ